MDQRAYADAPRHDGTNYVAIWGVLCALLGVSVLGPMIGIRLLTLITAFGIAIVKAYMVCRYFMHLRIEKTWVVYILGFMLALMLVFFGGVAPDVLTHEGLRWQKTYVEPAAPGAEP
jgi:caa(3)-type oxidase subunit IV